MSKEKKPGYSEFAFLLATSLVICPILIATYTGFIKSKLNVDYTTLWFAVMALLFSTLVFLFFSIKGRRKEHRRRCQAERMLTTILERIYFEGKNTENIVAELIINQVFVKPSDYQEYLQSLRDHPQEALTQYCLRAEIDLREKMIIKLSKANPKGEGKNSFSAAENNELDNRLLAKYEQIRGYLE